MTRISRYIILWSNPFSKLSLLLFDINLLQQNLQPNREESAVLKPVEETKANVEEEPNGNSIQQQASGNPGKPRKKKYFLKKKWKPKRNGNCDYYF